MLTEETHAAGVADRPATGAPDKVASHEDAAHEKRNWVRLTFDCNDHCVFCLDSDTHDGTMRDREEVKRQILEGRRAGATRLILSGGEPTIHPSYVDFIKLGARAGYRKIQTVTNGRLFSYGDFLKHCLDAGLGEITFSIHGPNAKVHDALVGTKGAFEEEMTALRGALADGRPIVNIDVVVNRGNVKQLPEMLRMFTELGVKEFDLLQVVPFGRAFTDGRDTLFYDLEEMRPYIQEALAYSKRPDVHLWMNRFPPQHLEGYEALIQDPYKLNDEVRGRKEEYARLLDEGIWLDCREPGRCKYCYLERLCDTLEGVITTVEQRAFDVVRVDTEWEAAQPAPFGGDPASAKRSKEDAKRRLPIAGSGPNGTTNGAAPRPAAPTLDELVASSGATTLSVRAPNLERAAAAIARFPKLTAIELDLDDYAGLGESLGDRGNQSPREGLKEDAPPRLAFGSSGPPKSRLRRSGGDDHDASAPALVRARARDVAQATALLAIDAIFEVTVDLTRDTAAWLLAQSQISPRIALAQPTYERLTEAAERDVDLRDFFARFTHLVAVDGVPACILGRAPRAPRRVLDTAMMSSDGRLEIFRYTRRYITERYVTKSLRCKGCAETARCEGMHINQVRAHGYAQMQPIAALVRT